MQNLTIESFRDLLQETIKEEQVAGTVDREKIKVKVATAINARVDFPIVGEAFEQAALEFLVSLVLRMAEKWVRKQLQTEG